MSMATERMDGDPGSGASLVVELFGEHALDPRRVGGKAAPLARAHAAGHRVPAAIVVTSDASGLGVERVRREIEPRLGALGAGPFAVRSSAIVEDGRSRSFAGQLETELGVERGAVADAVARCWASAHALRAIRYAKGEVGRVAVIVQRMVPADAAGVAFSADPRTGERGVVCIEAVRGLGDRLVSGGADPEAWRVTGAMAERTRATKTDVLDAERAGRIAKLARDLEALFGVPQDVEWAFEGDELHLLQSRPITALPAAPVPIPLEVPEGDWQRDDHHGVLSPLGWAWFQPYPKAMAAKMREIGMPIKAMETRLVAGQLYMRMVMEGGDGKPPPRWVLWLVTRLLPSMRKANRQAAELLDRETYMEQVDRWERELRPDLRRAIDALFVEDPSTLSDDELLGRIADAMALSARGLTEHASLHGPPLFSVGKLRLFVEDHLGWSTEQTFGLVNGSSSATTAMHREIERIVHAHRDELEDVNETPRTFASLAARCPRLAASLADWIAHNRLRMLHYDPKHATIGERPDVVLAVLDAVVESGRTATARDVPAEAREDALMREAKERLSAEKLAELERLVAAARRAYGLRDENGIETVSRPAGLLRHFVLELGRRIEDRIGEKEHAVYLHPEEHAPALRGEIRDLGARIARRRGQESWALAHRGPRLYGKKPAGPPPFDAFPDGLARVIRIFSWMEHIEATPDPKPGDEVLRGVGIGSRIVTARARVLDRPEALAAVRHGEVVVCRITSPEWSIGLGRVGAIVTDEGGMLSHPAIIAREHGIPAVLGTELATRRLKTGDLVRVDPVEGTVTRVGEGATA
ncbi:MAG: hypothetical protein IT379_33410 [Deltaproteobacteria bacterium]|nr:hypothetical protein [Deltaproteobacteria bacterium]